MNLYELRQVLIESERCGAETDIPEGSKYIKLSDTLVKQMIEAIDHHLGDD